MGLDPSNSIDRSRSTHRLRFSVPPKGFLMPERDFMKPGRSVALAEHAMVATAHPQATLAALEVLRSGGTSVDAAIAAVALQCVIDPHMTGLGGDCFAIHAPAGKLPVCLNGSGRSPSGASLERLRVQGLDKVPDLSAEAVTVPGAVGAWQWLSERYGRLGFDRSLAPAIEAAEQGFTITPRVARDWGVYADRLRRHPPAAAQYLPAGRAPVTGDRLTNPALARTLGRIAREGARAFYEGEIAADMIATLQAEGGTHNLEDLAAFRPQESAPITGDYRSYTLAECPPNGQGLAALIMVRLLDGFDVATSSEVDRIHLLTEATKAAYRQRDAIIADPAHMTITVDEILSEAFIAPLRARIDMTRAAPAEVYDLPVHRDTVHVTVVDRDGNATSLINSIFHEFGSGIYAAKSGILLQNRGIGFSLQPEHPNAFGPSKLPFHTIIPASLMEDGLPVMSFGVMGGQYQPVGHAQLLMDVLDRGLDVQMASDQPRSFWTDGVLNLEPTISPETRAALDARGHATCWATEPLGACQAIWIDRDRGVLWGASDHRKDGVALGY
jgi:gamma-glutamyltranspeptidase/glutathione hydrolase